MRNVYWEQFALSGKVEDYLCYKENTEQYEDKNSESVEYGDRNDTVGDTDRRI